MARIVKRAYKYRFYPTPEQADELARTFGCVRYIYNKALQERTRAYTQQGRRVSYVETSAMLTAWKKTPELAFLGEVSSVPLQQALRHLQAGFANFFAKRAKYPTFKSRKKSRASAEYTRSAFRWRDGQLTLAKMNAPLNIRWSRPLPEGAQPSTVTASRDSAGRWFVSILVEEAIRPLDPADNRVGVDAGITALVTLSTGEKVTNPTHERADRRTLARAQRALARKAKGSNNRAKARIKVARVYARIADRRRDHLHKVTTRLVRENQVIAVEDLTVRTMVRNRSLARAISDAAWRELRSMLEYKCAWYGREMVAVDRWFPSSKLCSACGTLQQSMPLSIRSWTCACGVAHDRDINAAKNILAAGLAER
ncbi:IS200/IS605 family element transposase accessory protein TnpB [Microbispora bryophytorum]|uniref:Transposase n=1 Tax=Microbispora bryophytorum TaxID=1460882 RepID=A0A8H9H3G8_9ACTN|nr:RNA-guided endonuclease TnpB family protein [Microbispora bryophytorum]MBD3138227.1 IS200/IS605 family element transposase accessory protein TnpB [Microbispora bryophytorum]TQS03984.1 IS200/IS605 family element transposase accessory protein TnpB [Microbispora bryophytorum]GGO25434.1 transposase [Microbispora bryophytorum]